MEKVKSFWHGTIIPLKLYDHIDKNIPDILGRSPYGAEDLPNY